MTTETRKPSEVLAGAAVKELRSRYTREVPYATDYESIQLIIASHLQPLDELVEAAEKAATALDITATYIRRHIPQHSGTAEGVEYDAKAIRTALSTLKELQS